MTIYKNTKYNFQLITLFASKKDAELDLQEGKFAEVWPTISSSFKSLKIDSTYVKEKDFTALFSYCSDLHSLSIDCLPNTFIIGKNI